MFAHALKAAFALSLFLLSACHKNSASSEPVSSPRVTCVDGRFQLGDMSGIIGGEPVDDKTWLGRTVVMLYDTMSSGMCTGVLVDRNVVLTAAHCVSRNTIYQPEKFVVIFSTQPECETDNKAYAKNFIQADKISVHPRYDDDFTDGYAERSDLALIRLSKPAPSQYITSTLTKAYISPQNRLSLVAGYGSTTGYRVKDNIPVMLRATWLMGMSENLKLATIYRIKEIYSKYNLWTADKESKVTKHFEDKETNEFIHVQQNQGRGICAGDSGGASFNKRDGRVFVTGIASTVSNPGSEESKSCELYGTHTNVIYHREWIEKAFRELRNYSSQKTTLFE